MTGNDLLTIARIAYEAQTAADNSVGTSANKAFVLLDEGGQGEAVERVKRCLENGDASVFGKVARSVADALSLTVPDAEPAPEPEPLPKSGMADIEAAFLRGDRDAVEFVGAPFDTDEEPETVVGKKKSKRHD